MNILTFLIVGLSLGASILMASYFGAKDYQHLKDEFATSVLSGLLLTIVLSGISLAGSRLFIRLTQTPEEISAQASLYLQIISLGLIFTFFYNIFSAALRAIGDSRAPLYVLILTTIVNVFWMYSWLASAASVFPVRQSLQSSRRQSLCSPSLSISGRRCRSYGSASGI